MALPADERAWFVPAPSAEQCLVVERPNKIVLLPAPGQARQVIARKLVTTHRTGSNRQVRFADDHLAGLGETPRSCKVTADRRMPALFGRLLQGFARWTAPLTALKFHQVSNQSIWRFLRE